MLTNPAVEQNKNITRVRGISPVGKKKVYGGKDLLKSQVLSSEWKTERSREHESGDSEDSEDDELPCVIGESGGDCIWRGSRRSAEIEETVGEQNRIKALHHNRQTLKQKRAATIITT